MQTQDLNEWEKAKSETTKGAMDVMNPALSTYVNGLDLITSYLSGSYSSGIRGSDFLSEDYYSKKMTNAMFMDGKAVFSIIDSSEYEELSAINKEKSTTLEYLPIKLPYSSSLNQSLPTTISYYLYINSKVSDEIKQQALDFISWYNKKDEETMNPLDRSLKSYVDTAHTMEYKFKSEAVSGWEEELLDATGFKSYLTRAVWSDEYKDEIKQYMMRTWYDN
jgi:hypothetical protein